MAPLLWAALLGSAAFLPETPASKPEPSIQGKPLADWVKRLQDPSPVVRQQTARALGILGLGARPALPALVKALGDNTEAVRLAAAMSLAQIGPDARDAPGLRKALVDPNSMIRVHAAYALWRADPKATGYLDVLRQALTDKVVVRRTYAAYYLSRIGPGARAAIPDLVKALQDTNIRYSAQQALRAIGPEAVPILVKMLEGKNVAARQSALLALAAMGDKGKEALPAIVRALKDSNGAVRSAAVYALGIVGPGSREALDALAVALKDPLLRYAVAQALPNFGKAAVPLLLKAFETGDRNLRIRVAGNLGLLGPNGRAAVPALTAALKDKDLSVRVAAATALWGIEKKADDVVEILLEATRSTEVGVSQQATFGLAQVGAAAVPRLTRALRDKNPKERAHAVRLLGHLRVAATAAVPDFVKALGDKDEEVRLAATGALGGVGPAAVKPLLEALAGTDQQVRRYAAGAFRTMPLSRQAITALENLLKDPNGYVRVNAAAALKRTGRSKAALSVLIEAVKAPEVGVRALAVSSLGQLVSLTSPEGKTVREALTAALKDEDASVRLKAVNALVQSTLVPNAPAVDLPPGAVDIVAGSLTKGTDEERRTAALALAQLGVRAAPAAPALAAALKDKQDLVRQHAAYALGAIGTPARAAVPALAEALRDRVAAVRQLAAQALAAQGPQAKEAVEALLAALKDADMGVRLDAAEALGRIGPSARTAVPALLDMLKTTPRPSVPSAGFPRRFVPWGMQPLGNPRLAPAGGPQVVAARALGRIGPEAREAVTALFKLLQENSGLRLEAAAALRGIGEPAAAVLTRGLADSGIRPTCIESLGAIGAGDKEAVAGLAKVLADGKPPERVQAAFALGLIGPSAKAAVPALVQALADGKDVPLRVQAARALRAIDADSPEAVAALRMAVRDLSDLRPRPKSATPAGVPEKYRPTVAKGLAWLVKQQHPDGHWSVGGRYPTAMTALSGMALLAEGSTTSKGAYAANLRRAVAWLVDHSQPNGRIDDESLGGSNMYVFGHGYSILFLASVYEREKDAVRRRQVGDVLNRAVQFSAAAQSSRGGWGYVAARDGSDFDEGACTVVQVQALRAARQAGIPVPAPLLASAVRYLERATDSDGGVVYSLSMGGGGGGRPALTAGALASLSGLDDFDSPAVRKWADYCRKHLVEPSIRKDRFGNDDFTTYYYAQAVHGFGDKGYAKLFPDSKEGDRVRWSTYRLKLFAALANRQTAEGIWPSNMVGIGPVYSTALYLTLLQLDNETVPIYQR